MNKINDTGPPAYSIWDNNQRTPQKHYNIYVKVTGTKNTIYNDQMGKFPVISIRGHK